MDSLKKIIWMGTSHQHFNIFQRSINGVSIRIFLSTLSEQYYCAGQVGALMLDEMSVEDPETIFGPSDGAIPFVETKIGFHDGFLDLHRFTPHKQESIELSMGAFCATRKYTYGDCFFPHITPSFWQALPHAFVYHHGVVLYIAPLSAPEETIAQINQLLAAPFPGETEWVQAVTALYAVVVRVGGDGDCLWAWTQDDARFDLLQDAFSAEEARIREWLQTPDGQDYLRDYDEDFED